jgi:hypothetical protein
MTQLALHCVLLHLSFHNLASFMNDSNTGRMQRKRKPSTASGHIATTTRIACIRMVHIIIHTRRTEECVSSKVHVK